MRWQVLAAVLAVSACVDPSGDRIDDVGEVAEPILDETVCAIQDEVPAVEFVPPPAGTNEEVTDRGTYAVTLRNNTDRTGTVSLTVYSDSQEGRLESPGGAVDLAPGSRSVAIRLADLGLPTGEFDFSGSLTFVARITFADGSDQDATFGLSYHPTARGWRVYDGDAREADFDGGALTAAARRGRDEALARAPEGTVVVAAGGYVEKVSDSTDWLPPEDL